MKEQRQILIPENWIRKLVEIAEDEDTNIAKMDYLLGYINSAKEFLKNGGGD